MGLQLGRCGYKGLGQGILGDNTVKYLDRGDSRTELHM